MKITLAQRITIMKLWQRVCKDRDLKASNRAQRLATFSQIVGRMLDSTDDVGRVDECTKLMKGLEAMLGISLQAARESDDTTINKARVLRYQIINELVPCLELYISDVRAYLAEIMADKNRWWRIDRPAREIQITDLDATPIIRTDKLTGQLREFPSQLEQLQYTLTARLSAKRKEAGHTVHDMRTRAKVHCACAKCQHERVINSLYPGAESPETTETVARTDALLTMNKSGLPARQCEQPTTDPGAITSMSKPALTKINQSSVALPLKTMFFTEGNPCGILIENRAGRRTEKVMGFDSAHAALSWCQSHGSNLFYTATNIQNG
jgi:hypothetical protein